MHLRLRTPDAFGFDLVVGRVAEACGVEDVQRHTVDVDPLADYIAGRAGYGRDDGCVISRESIQEARLPRVWTAGDHDGHAFAKQAALPGTLLDALEMLAHGLKALGQLAVCKEVDFLLRKVDRRLDVGTQIDDGLGEAAHHVGELALQRAHGRAHGFPGAGIDEVGNGFGLGEIELVVEESPLREFARLSSARTELHETGHQRLLDERASMSLELENMFPGIGMRTRKEEG